MRNNEKLRNQPKYYTERDRAGDRNERAEKATQ